MPKADGKCERVHPRQSPEGFGDVHPLSEPPVPMNSSAVNARIKRDGRGDAKPCPDIGKCARQRDPVQALGASEPERGPVSFATGSKVTHAVDRLDERARTLEGRQKTSRS